MIKFEKVSFEEFLKAVGEYSPITNEDEIKYLHYRWENLKLPTRSTSGSAGYDFFAPLSFRAGTDFEEAKLYPTGIRFVTDRDDIVLLCVPKSGLGCKFGVGLANTIGVIDSDYCKSDNEGHIKVKFVSEKDTILDGGKAFMQGIIVSYLTIDDDSVETVRNGGFGSTGV